MKSINYIPAPRLVTLILILSEINSFHANVDLNGFEPFKSLRSTHEKPTHQIEVITHSVFILPINSTNLYRINDQLISVQSNAIVYVNVSDQSVNVYDQQLIDVKVVCLEEFTHNETTYRAISFINGETKIYTKRDGSIDPWHVRQTIKNSKIATSLMIFASDNDIYLFIVNTDGGNLVPSTLYRWKITYFDEIQKMLTTGANQAVRFFDGDKHVIFVTQSAGDTLADIGAVIFTFQNHMRLSQILSPIQSWQITPLSIAGQSLIVVGTWINQRSIIRVWKWNGYELLHSFDVQQSLGLIRRFSFVEINHKTYLIAVEFVDSSVFCTINEINVASYKKIGSFPLSESGDSFVTGLDARSIDSRVVLIITFNKFSVVATFEINENTEPINLESISRSFSANNDREQKLIAFLDEIKRFKTLIKHNQLSDLYKLNDLVKDYQSRINNFKETLRKKAIDRQLRVKSSVKVKNISIDSISVNQINGNVWPKNWLKHNASQNVTTMFHVEKLNVNHLTLKNQSIFSDILMKTGNQTFHNNVVINNLHANNLNVESINNLTLARIVTRVNNHVTATKTFPKLIVSNATVYNWNRLNLLPCENQSTSFYSPVKVDQLIVGEVNGVNFTLLAESLVRKADQLKTINGSLTFTTPVHIENLNTTQINQVEINNLMTISTDQLISSTIEMNKSVLIPNLNTNKLNNIDSNQFVSFDTINLTIHGKVSAYEINVTNNVVMNANEMRNVYRQITWPNTSTLMQVYTGTVHINGDLFVNKMKIKNDTRVIVANQSVPRNIREIYWMKRVDQQIQQLFTLRGKIETNRLFTVYVNDLLPDFEGLIFNGQASATLQIHRLSVGGDLILKNVIANNPNLRHFDFRMVKRNDSTRIVRGVKVYTQPLKFGEIFVHEINNQSVLDAMDKLLEYKYRNVQTKMINGIDADEFFKLKDRVVIDNEIDIDSINATHVNGIDLERLIDINRMKSNDIVIDSLNISGDVSVKNVIAPRINGFNFIDLRDQYLKSSGDQELTGMFTTKTVTAESITTPQINNQSADNLIFTGKPIYFNGSMTFNTLKINNLQTKSINDRAFTLHLTNSSLKINKINNAQANDIFIPETSKLHYVLTNSFMKNANQTVNAKVTFKNDVFVRDLSLEGLVNDINITTMLDDALVNNLKTPQVVSGSKTFKRLTCDHVNITNDFHPEFINNERTADVFNDLVVMDQLNQRKINGLKMIVGNAFIDRLNINGKINTFNLNDFVTINSDKSIDFLQFTRLNVSNINVKFINNVDFDQFLRTRLVKESDVNQLITAAVRTEYMQINGSAMIGLLNDVNMSNVIHDSNEINYLNKVYITNGHIDQADGIQSINGYDVKSIADDVVYRNDNVVLNGTFHFKREQTINGVISMDNLNDQPLESMIDSLQESIDLNITSNQTIRDQITDNLRLANYIHNASDSVLLYVDESTTTLMRLPHATHVIDVTAITHNDQIHVDMIVNCSDFYAIPCRRQHHIVIMTNHTYTYENDHVNDIVYTYYDSREKYYVNVVTNSLTNRHVINRFTLASRNVDFISNVVNVTGTLDSVKFIWPRARDVHALLSFTSHVNGSEIFLVKIHQTGFDHVAHMHVSNSTMFDVAETSLGVLLFVVEQDYSRENYTHIYLLGSDSTFKLIKSVQTTVITSILTCQIEHDTFVIIVQQSGYVMVLKTDPPHVDTLILYQTMFFDSTIISAVGFQLDDTNRDYYIAIITDDTFEMFAHKHIEGFSRMWARRTDNVRFFTHVTSDRTYLIGTMGNDVKLFPVALTGRGIK